MISSKIEEELGTGRSPQTGLKGRGRAVWACPLPPDLGENQLG